MTDKGNGHPNSAMDQAVADCFGALLGAIHTSADEWRTRATEALQARDDARAEECLAGIQRITEMAGEVETLYHNWENRWPALLLPSTPVPSPGSQPKGHASKLRAHLNNKVVEYPYAAETFARTIEAIGIERVARLGKALSGIALVGTSKATDYQQQFAIGKFYVCTHSNTPAKKRLLEEIAAELGVPLRVEIISQ
jgi:hypothetical protein